MALFYMVTHIESEKYHEHVRKYRLRNEIHVHLAMGAYGSYQHIDSRFVRLAPMPTNPERPLEMAWPEAYAQHHICVCR